MPPKVANHNKRKVLIYAGLAAAMLLVIVLVRRGSSSSSSGDTSTVDGSTLPAADTSGGDAGGVDDSGELSSIDTDIQTLGQAVAAIQSSQQTAGSTSGNGTTDTVSDIINAATGAFQAGAAAVQQQAPTPVTVTVTSPKQPGAGNTKVVKPGTKLTGGAIEAPSGSKKPAAKAGYTVVGLGGGRWEYKPNAKK